MVKQGRGDGFAQVDCAFRGKWDRLNDQSSCLFYTSGYTVLSANVRPVFLDVKSRGNNNPSRPGRDVNCVEKPWVLIPGHNLGESGG